VASGLLSKKIGFTHARRKDTDFYLHRTLSFSFERIEKPGTKEDIFAKAVVDALRELGGQVDRQGD